MSWITGGNTVWKTLTGVCELVDPHVFSCTAKTEILNFLLLVSGLTAHPHCFLLGEVLLKCILGDVSLLYNLAAGHHSCQSATQQTCTFTHTADAKELWKDSTHLRERHANTQLTQNQKQNQSLVLSPSIFLEKHVGDFQNPLVNLFILLSHYFAVAPSKLKTQLVN